MTRSIALTCMLLLGVSCSRTPPPPPPMPADMASLDPQVRALVEGRLETIAEAPDEVERRFALGLVYEANGLFQLARATYGQVIDLAPDRAGPRHRLALTEERLGDMETAAQIMSAAIDLEPGHPGAHWQLGLWLLDLGRFADAEFHLARAIQLAPASVPAQFGLIRLFLERGEASEAERLIRKEKLLESRFGAAHQLLTTSLRQQGRHDEADEVARRAGPAPAFSAAWHEVLRPLRRGMTSRKQDVVALFEAGRTEAATELLQDILRDDPDDPNVLVNLAIAQAGRGDIFGARASLERAILVKGDHYAANLNMSLVLNRLGTRDPSLLDGALAHAERAATIRPDAGDPHRARGDILAQMERVADALRAYDEAYRLDGRSPAPKVQAGALLLRLGQLDAAAHAYEIALSNAPDDVAALLGMASTRLAQNRLDEATALLDRAQALPGVTPRALVGLRQRIATARAGG